MYIARLVILKKIIPNMGRSIWVLTIHRVVATVGKHVIAQQTLSGRSESIGVEESTCFGVVITALAVVKPGFVGLHIAGRGGLGPAWRGMPYAENRPGPRRGCPPPGGWGLEIGRLGRRTAPPAFLERSNTFQLIKKRIPRS